MEKRLLPQIEDRLRTYESEHRGERPLYIILPKEDAEHLIGEVKAREGYEENVTVTEFEGTKIVQHDALKPGEMRLTNELPDTGS